MSKINDLMQKLTSSDIKYKKVEDIAKISRGKVMSKDFLKENQGEYPVYSSQTENEGKLGAITTYMFDGEYLTWTTDGANAGTVFYRSGKFSVTNVCGVIDIESEDVLPKYLYYFLNLEAPNHVNAGMGNPKLMSNVMARINVPVPPLEVQREIVHVLDSFTFLTAELTAELTARKKQYEFYRSKLISEVEGEEVKIKSVFTRLKGTPITASQMKDIACDDGEIRIFAGGKTVINAKEEDIAKANITRVPAVLVQSRGIIDFVYYDKPFTFKNEMWAYTCEDKVLLKYLYYVLKNDVLHFRDAASGMGSLPQISLPVTEDYTITIPSKDSQKRIVDILDRFEVLTNDILDGIPAEIEARKQQYEYYREKLFNF